MKFKNNSALCFGEVLWDRLPTGAKPGGAPLNVALHLSAIGLNASVASKVGKDEAGEELVAFLKNSGVDTSLIQTDENLPTSEVLVHLDESNNATYEICEPVAWDNINLSKELLQKANECGLLIYGSLASRNKTTRNTLLKLLETDAVKLIDVNLRKPYDKQEVLEILLIKSDIVKLNDDELAVFGHWRGVNSNVEKKLIEWFVAEYGFKMVCVTKGDKGATMYFEGQFYEHPGFKVHAVDTVGAGDAFLAGIVAAFLLKKDPNEAIALACATGAFVASQAGATPKYDMQVIEKIMAG